MELNTHAYAGGGKSIDYQIVCDDDISFSPTFAEELIKLSNENNCDIIIPNNQKGISKKKSSMLNFLTAFLGQRFISNKSPYRIKVAKTAGFISNPHLKENLTPTQSGIFTCFLMRNKHFDLNLKDELWLDDTPYSWPDDQVFFYKAYLNNLKVYHCKNPQIKHLDHGKESKDRKINATYAGARNAIIFWHRFLFKQSNSTIGKASLLLAITYRIINNTIYNLLQSAIHRNISFIKTYFIGIKNGLKYLKSPTYLRLNNVK